MLTAKQKQLLDFIRAHNAATGTGPTIREMREGVGLKSSGRVHQALESLEERGCIRRIRYRARAIEVLPPQEAAFISAARTYLPPDQFAAIQAIAHGSAGIASDLAEIVGGAR